MPASYKEFLSLFGAGSFYGILSIRSPFSPHRDLFLEHHRTISRFTSERTISELISHRTICKLTSSHAFAFWDNTTESGLIQVGGDSQGGALFVPACGDDSYCVSACYNQWLYVTMSFADTIWEFLRGEMVFPSMGHLPAHPTKEKSLSFVPEQPMPEKGIFG